MRKLNKGRQFSMKIGPRVALLKSLSRSLLLHEKIKTTEAKAKTLRGVVEKMITRAKVATVANRRILAKETTPEIVKKIVNEIAPRYKDRKGGYTRITKLGQRNSDGAKMAIIELIK
ncbi:MAG: 50S ribosomal protein L17 [Synergistaceae bacterium]|jgi:large subunit ribosomal protein L17|nr:50S ribosomal protein L17 [Synergistaceae bacterium]